MYEGEEMKFTGLIIVETDDLLGGGIGDHFHKSVAELRKKYNFGKWVELMDQSHEYGGRTLRQTSDYGFTISMVRYLRERAREIKLDRGRCKDPNAKANATEISLMRGLTGKINWATREGMPNGCGDASLLSATLPEPQIKDLQEANACLRRLLQAEAIIIIRPIPLDRLKLLHIGDSSLGNTKGGTSQLAHMICAADVSILDGHEADVSVLTYQSHRMTRSGSSTLLVEANAMSEGLADAEWVASWIGLVKDFNYDLRKRHLLNREFKITSIISTDDESQMNIAAITDAKSLYDNLVREQYSGAEKRAALEICVIKDSLDSL